MYTYSLDGKKVYIAGHRGMVGQAIMKALSTESCQILTANRENLDLRNQSSVDSWFQEHRPEVVFLAAAKVGGILANHEYPADFLYDNLQIQQNIIWSAHNHKVEKLVFLGSSCIYPKLCPQPIVEESLLSGFLEETNQWYAIAKIAGLKLVESLRMQHNKDFISVMPCNLFGPGDRYDAEKSHVIPALLMKFHQAKIKKSPSLTLWGSGTPFREFLFVDDLAEACIFLCKQYSDSIPLNVGSGKDISIADLAKKIAKIVGYEGKIHFDPTKPDGTPKKLLNTTRINELGWHPKTTLEEGLNIAYADFLRRQSI